MVSLKLRLPSLSTKSVKALILRLRGKAKPRQGDRRHDRKRALEWHRMSIKGVYTERRRCIRRDEDRPKYRYDPWYTFYEFNPKLQESRVPVSGGGRRGR